MYSQSLFLLFSLLLVHGSYGEEGLHLQKGGEKRTIADGNKNSISLRANALKALRNFSDDSIKPGDYRYDALLRLINHFISQPGDDSPVTTEKYGLEVHTLADGNSQNFEVIVFDREKRSQGQGGKASYSAVVIDKEGIVLSMERYENGKSLSKKTEQKQARPPLPILDENEVAPLRTLALKTLKEFSSNDEIRPGEHRYNSLVRFLNLHFPIGTGTIDPTLHRMQVTTNQQGYEISVLDRKTDGGKATYAVVTVSSVGNVNVTRYENGSSLW